jgi:hypothetical protein
MPSGGMVHRFCCFGRLGRMMRRLGRRLLLCGTAQHHGRENRPQYHAGSGASKQMQEWHFQNLNEQRLWSKD